MGLTRHYINENEFTLIGRATHNGATATFPVIFSGKEWTSVGEITITLAALGVINGRYSWNADKTIVGYAMAFTPTMMLNTPPGEYAESPAPVDAPPAMGRLEIGVFDGEEQAWLAATERLRAILSPKEPATATDEEILVTPPLGGMTLAELESSLANGVYTPEAGEPATLD